MAMIKVGDRVKFLNDVGGGIVTRFIGKNRVNVENEDGFEIPYPVSELVNIDAPEFDKETAKKPEIQLETTGEKQPQPEITPEGEIINGKNSPDFYFCLVPTNSKNPVDGDIELYLVNDSNFTVLYHFSHFYEEKNVSVKHGTVPSNSRIILESLGRNDLNELPVYGFQLIYFRNEEKDWHESISKKIKVNPVKFYKETSFPANRFFKSNAMVLQITQNLLSAEIDKLTDDDFKKVVQQKSEEKKEIQKVKKQNPEVVEVDLHINQLMDNAYGLSKLEMLQLQKDRVESEMRSAIQSGVEKVIFIHGVGQGVLKQEIAKLLKTKFPKYRFQDASFQEYGYGATMVVLRR